MVLTSGSEEDEGSNSCFFLCRMRGGGALEPKGEAADEGGPSTKHLLKAAPATFIPPPTLGDQSLLVGACASSGSEWREKESAGDWPYRLPPPPIMPPRGERTLSTYM